MLFFTNFDFIVVHNLYSIRVFICFIMFPFFYIFINHFFDPRICGCSISNSFTFCYIHFHLIFSLFFCDFFLLLCPRHGTFITLLFYLLWFYSMLTNCFFYIISLFAGFGFCQSMCSCVFNITFDGLFPRASSAVLVKCVLLEALQTYERVCKTCQPENETKKNTTSNQTSLQPVEQCSGKWLTCSFFVVNIVSRKIIPHLHHLHWQGCKCSPKTATMGSYMCVCVCVLFWLRCI